MRKRRPKYPKKREPHKTINKRERKTEKGKPKKE
jgi:hypothetical protein